MDSRLLFLLGVVAAILFFYLLYNLINRDEHPIVAYFLLILIITIGLYLPKAIIDTRTECSTELMNTTTSKCSERYSYMYGDNYTGYHWDYGSPPPTSPQNMELFHLNITYYRGNASLPCNETTAYEYGQVCVTKEEDTPMSFMNIIYWAYLLIMAYVLFSTVFKTLKAIADLRVRKR